MTFERILAELQEGRRLLEERGVVVAADSGAFDLLALACREIDQRGQALDAWRSLGDAAADEIESRWHAHTDEEGAGPVSLVRRLRSRDGALYTPEGWRERQAVVAYLRTAPCDSPGHDPRWCQDCQVREHAADAIECGVHRNLLNNGDTNP